MLFSVSIPGLRKGLACGRKSGVSWDTVGVLLLVGKRKRRKIDGRMDVPGWSNGCRLCQRVPPLLECRPSKVRIVCVPRDGQSCRRRRFSLLCRPWTRGWQNTTKLGPSLREGPVTGGSGEGGCGVTGAGMVLVLRGWMDPFLRYQYEVPPM